MLQKTKINNTRRNNREILLTILQTLYDNRETALTSIIAKVNTNHTKLMRCLSHLTNDGLIVYEQVGAKKKVYYLTEKGYVVMNTYRAYKEQVPEYLQ